MYIFETDGQSSGRSLIVSYAIKAPKTVGRAHCDISDDAMSAVEYFNKTFFAFMVRFRTFGKSLVHSDLKHVLQDERNTVGLDEDKL